MSTIPTPDNLLAYASRSNAPILVESFVLFIDSLGSQAVSRDLALQQQRLDQLSAGIAAARSRGGLPTFDSFASTATFTDNIVVGFPVDATGVPPLSDADSTWAVYLRALLAAAGYQTELIRHGIFIRGGITVGPLWIDAHLVFGSGLLDAYRLEHESAVYPRVIVSDGFVEAGKSLVGQLWSAESEAWLDNLLIRGRDGRYFVNYLFDDQIQRAQTSAAPGEFGSVLTVPVQPTADFLRVHRAAVGEGLLDNADNPHVYEKYLWAANYHNYFCQKYGYLEEQMDRPPDLHEFSTLTESI